MSTYTLTRSGDLLFTNGAIKGKDGVLQFKLLVDTGSTFTVVPWEYLTKSGYEPFFPADTVQITTASSIVIAPRIKVEWFSCCGLLLDSFPLVAHTLPTSLSRVGILGMDFLRQAEARLDIFNARVYVRD